MFRSILQDPYIRNVHDHCRVRIKNKLLFLNLTSSMEFTFLLDAIIGLNKTFSKQSTVIYDIVGRLLI